MSPFDARCAADAQDGRNVFTTPTENHIPEFPRIHGQEIVTYEDGLWGPQEYTRWPQMYNEACIHHACIPRYGSDDSPGIQVYEGFGFQPWEESPTHPVTGFGFLKKMILDELSTTATRVIRRFEQALYDARAREVSTTHRSSAQERLGKTLCVLLRNALDRLRLLPTTQAHALVTGRMAHRLILELSGLTVYYNVVAPRMANVSPLGHMVLKVLGAFVRNASTAQLFHRIGLPYWYIQPWSPALIIQKVVQTRPWSRELSATPASPRIPKSWYDPDGTHQDPGRWTHPTVVFVCNLVCSSSLPELRSVIRSEGAEREAKRFKGDDASRPLLSSTAKPDSTQRNAKKRGTRSRGARAGAKARDPHPSTTFDPAPSDLVEVSPNWHAALSRVSPLPSPPPVASVYFLPPPFLILNASTHRARYIHNYTRIRLFCKQRLVDGAINGSPLRIVDWRHALYGDYRLDVHDDVHATSASGSTSAQVQGDRTRSVQYDRAQAVRELFAKCGGLASYDETGVWKYRGLQVNVDMAKADDHLRALVVWELFEMNWRCELRALDDRLVGQREDAFRRWERDQVIANVWRTGEVESAHSALDASSPTFVWTPAGKHDWKNRRANLRHFLHIVSAWPKAPEFLRTNTSTILDCEDEWLFNQVESCAIHFYVDSFVGQFHRLPSPPVQLRSRAT
ncbi:uncharacterized protein C8Q71DRAFT_718459 [Rhodofomes roseus]|nr:uncharacterized protein C8Q71DRAFT_718459 [Rhodofomes roseus]KAH9829316.1 hypothetical protein C8Q71DRAFT_718459 [Rhodofomes roseus]